MFDGRVLVISEDVMFKWRLLVEDGRKTGYTFSQPDLIIAATALHYDLTVVTRDVRDYPTGAPGGIQPVGRPITGKPFDPHSGPLAKSGREVDDTLFMCTR